MACIVRKNRLKRTNENILVKIPFPCFLQDLVTNVQSLYNSLSLLAFLKHLKTSSDISYLKTLLQDTKQAKEAKDNPVTIRSVKEKATNTK